MPSKTSKNYSSKKIELLLISPNTIRRTITDEAVNISPSSLGVLFSGKIQFSLPNVVFARERVDLEHSRGKLYLVEHTAAFCALSGIHSGIVKGTNSKWNLCRPSHQVAQTNGDGPDTILGRSDGRIWKPEVPPLELKSLKNIKTQFWVINREFHFKDEFGTNIVMSPPNNIRAMTIKCHHKHYSAEVIFSLFDGIPDTNIKRKILRSRSIAVIGSWNEEAIWHAIGDVIGDLIGIGRLCADIDVELHSFYHNATIGCLRTIL